MPYQCASKLFKQANGINYKLQTPEEFPVDFWNQLTYTMDVDDGLVGLSYARGECVGGRYDVQISLRLALGAGT